MDYPTNYLEKIDNKEELSEREIRDLLDEFQVMQDEGDDRRWSKTVTSLVRLADRYFVITWERGLTEYQDDEYMDQPVEVFNPTPQQYISYKTLVHKKDGTTYTNFDGLLDEHIEQVGIKGTTGIKGDKGN